MIEIGDPAMHVELIVTATLFLGTVCCLARLAWAANRMMDDD